jgi:hypothetical protein
MVSITKDGNTVILFWKNEFMPIINLQCLRKLMKRVILSFNEALDPLTGKG